MESGSKCIRVGSGGDCNQNAFHACVQMSEYNHDHAYGNSRKKIRITEIFDSEDPGLESM